MWFWQRSKSALRINPPVRRVTSRGVRVSARIDGREIWFESADTKLAASAEAFGSLMLIPALQARRPLVIVPAVCGVWAANARQIVPLVSSWWEYDPILPQMTEIAPTVASSGTTALCFSGGVDSFFSLLRGSQPIDVLVCAMGYDLKLRDTPRRALVERLVRAVAAERGQRAWLVASNLRQHRAVRSVPWERSHGGALAALGHVLGGEIGCLVISSSNPLVDNYPWGSRWDVDPKFSSAGLRIEHFGAEFGRVEKLQSIAHEDLVRRYLRVCWENRSSDSNCGQCEKCVRTMMILEACGQLGSYPTFRGGQGLLDSLDRLPYVSYSNRAVYESLLAQGLSAPFSAAVNRLLARSRLADQP
jgi:hypothetical protein